MTALRRGRLLGRRPAGLIAAVAALLLLWLAVTPSVEAETSSVTLSAQPSEVTYGEVVHVSGEASGAPPGTSVEIVADDGSVLATPTTTADGSYEASLTPERNVAIVARTADAVSSAVSISVRPALGLRLRGVRLFDRASVVGVVRPSEPEMRATVTVSRPDGTDVTRTPRISSDGRWSVRIVVRSVGAYRATVTVTDDDHADGVAASPTRTTPLPSLRRGDSEISVELLERRLRDLAYRITNVNDTFDAHTAHAVIAFRKVQGLERTERVDAEVWRALADPVVPRARLETRGVHLEVDQGRQVLYVVEASRITSIVDASTGKPSTPTRNGRFRVYRKVDGLAGGGMYYPNFFNGSAAVHGYEELPPYAASHGCVRIPYADARWMSQIASIGTTVLVYS